MAITTDGNTNLSSLWQKDRAHFLHPWTHFDTFKRDGSLVIREAKGAYVTDAAGQRYLDGIGGLWCVNIGSHLPLRKVGALGLAYMLIGPSMDLPGSSVWRRQSVFVIVLVRWCGETRPP
jgi:hypothetical protein